MSDLPVPRPPSIDTIKRLCAGAYGISLIDMDSHRKDQRAVRARHVAMWMARKLTGHSLPIIGLRFGNRDHTTVLHAVRRVDALLETDAALRADTAGLVAALTFPPERRAA